MNKQPTIFLSYSWMDKEIADTIDRDFQKLNMTLIRDERNAPYRTSIEEFMQQIGKSDLAIMLISDGFLKSKNCMYEVLELLNTRELEKRILPVILENTSFLNTQSRTIYYDYWDDEIKKTKENLDKYTTQDFFNEFKHQKNIRNMLDIFFVKVSDLKTEKFQELRKSNYKSILQIINSNNSPILDKKQTEVLTVKAMVENESHLNEEINSLQELYSVWKDKNLTGLQKKRIENAFSGKEVVWDVYVTSIDEPKDGRIFLSIVHDKEMRLESAYALAYFDSKDEEVLALLSKGEKIRIKGTIGQFYISPLLQDCKLLGRLKE
jgi:TIR domain